MATSNDIEEQHTPPPSLPSSPFPRWSDGRSRPPPSQWLHSTLSELDEKIKTILDLIEDNGDTFAKRAEMYYQKRPQLIKMVQDLHGSYKTLVDKYDHALTKLESSINPSTTSLSNSFGEEHEEGATNGINELSTTSLSDSFIKGCEGGKTHRMNELSTKSLSDSFNIRGCDRINKLSTKSLPNSFIIRGCQEGKILRNNEEFVQDFSFVDDSSMRENDWINKQTKYSELLEENLRKQSELIRRNDEKREVINKMRNENMILSQKEGVKGKNKPKRKLLKGLFCFSLNNSS